MKYFVVLSVPVLVLGLCVPVAKAQTVTIASANYKEPGKVSVGGPFTLPPGWTIKQIKILVMPANGVGGQGAEGTTTIHEAASLYTGTARGVPPGVFDVWVIMQVLTPTRELLHSASEMKPGINRSSGL
jgi:hypothetical protein